MTNEEFTDQFIKLTEAFTVSKPEQKARIYYSRLSYIRNTPFINVVEIILDQSTRFPTIADIRNTYSSLPQEQEIRDVSCSKCLSGNGLIKIGLEVYRARCMHGHALNPMIKLAPETDKIAIEEFNQKHTWDSLYAKGYWDKRIESRSN